MLHRLIEKYVNRSKRRRCHCSMDVFEYSKTHSDAETMAFWVSLCYGLHGKKAIFFLPAIGLSGLVRLATANDVCDGIANVICLFAETKEEYVETVGGIAAGAAKEALKGK